jgi:4-carboxymuconolactone decarboxylase
LSAPLRGPGSVPLDLKELTILRVAHATGSDRQWTHHSGLAAAAGVVPGTLEAARGDLDGGPFTATQRSVLRLADELCAGGAVAESTFASVLAAVGAEQTVELVVLVNYYRGLAGVLAAFGLT